MRKIAAITLLLSLFAPVFMPGILVNLKKAGIRREVSSMICQGIEEKDLTFLEFRLGEMDHVVQWEHGHEFEFNGNMYDVVNMDTADQIIQVWCWKDHDETGLYKNMKMVARQSQQDKTQKNKQYLRLLHFYSHLYWSEQTNPKNHTDWNHCSFLPYTNHWKRIYLSPPNPPPINC